jgi:hypothetical protein
LRNGIASFALHYAYNGEPIPLVMELRVAPAGTEVTNVFEETRLVGRIDTTATNTGSWAAPGNILSVEKIENPGSDMMDLYLLFLPGGINIVEVVVEINV